MSKRATHKDFIAGKTLWLVQTTIDPNTNEVVKLPPTPVQVLEGRRKVPHKGWDRTWPEYTTTLTYMLDGKPVVARNVLVEDTYCDLEGPNRDIDVFRKRRAAIRYATSPLTSEELEYARDWLTPI